MHTEISQHFYDLILKKSISFELKSLELHLELSACKSYLNLFTFLKAPEGQFDFLAVKEEFSANQVGLDSKANQVIFAKQLNFKTMCPEIFSLKIIQFHSDAKRCQRLLKQEPCYVLKNSQ